MLRTGKSMTNIFRPQRLSDIVGQKLVKECISILLKSRRGKSLPHILFESCGPGLGKTTFAYALANETGSDILLANGGNISKPKHVLPLLARLKRGDILFIDEIHRISSNVQESLFTVMEDFRYDIAKGANSIHLEEFTLIGATTEAGMLLRPFYDRFEHHFHLDYYNIEDLTEIVLNSSRKLGCFVDKETAEKIAQLSRFTPRIANSFLSWCNDFAKSNGNNLINSNIFDQARRLKQIESNGIDLVDKKYLDSLERFGRPAGITTICAATGLSRSTIESQIEPFLIKLGLVMKTTKGRVKV